MERVFFERLCLLAIVANSIVIAIADYSHIDNSGNLVTSGSLRNTISVQSEQYFTYCFLLECVVKVTALGFIGDSPAYLSDPWNWLDFIVVLAGCGMFAITYGNNNLIAFMTFQFSLYCFAI